MPGASAASVTLQYTGIAFFVAIVLFVVLYYSIFLTRRHGATGDAAPVQALGLGPDDVAALPTFTYRGEAMAPPEHAASPAECCAVCLDELRQGALVRMLASCKHYFHAECVDVWLRSHATCPVCRGSPGQEKARLGVASLSPPLPQLRRCGAASPLAEGGDTSAAEEIVSSRSPSPAARSPVRFEVVVAAMGNGDTELSPSPTRPRTPPVGRVCRTRSPSPVTTESNGVQV